MPLFAWRGLDGATRDVLDVCADRSCTLPLAHRETTASRVTLDTPLSGLRAFWRVTSVLPTGETRTGATWVVRLPPRAAAAPSARAFLEGADVNGDGFADLIFPYGPNVLRGGLHFRDGTHDPDVFASPPPGFDCGPAPFAHGGVATWGGARFHRPCADVGPAQYVGDVDGDGFGDMLVRVGDSWRLARGSAAVELPIVASSLLARAGPGSIRAIGDVDGDGFADVAFTGADRALYWGGPDGLREDRKTPLGAVAAISQARIDDVTPEKLLARKDDIPPHGSDPRSQLVNLDFAGRVEFHVRAVVPADLATNAPVTVVAGDFVGTGAACFLLGPEDVGPAFHLAWVGCGSQPSPPSPSLGGRVGHPSQRLGLAATDADGDGIQDAYVSASGEGGSAFLLRGGAHPALAATPLSCPLEATSCGDVVAVGDVDGDGLGDALFTWHDSVTNDDHLTFLPGSTGNPRLDSRLTWAVPRDGQ